MNRLLLAVFAFCLVSGLAPRSAAQLEILPPQVRKFAESGRSCDPAGSGRIFLFEIIAVYGDYAHDINRRIERLTGPHADKGHRVAPNLWYRIAQTTREPHEDILVQGAGDNQFGMVVEGRALHWVNRFENWRSQSSGVSDIGGSLAVYDFKRWGYYRERSDRGYSHRRYGIYLEGNDDEALPEGDLTASQLLQLLVRKFEETRNAKVAGMIIDIGRFFPLTAFLEPEEVKKVLQRAKRKVAQSGVVDFVARRRGGIPARRNYFEQAVIRAGLSEMIDTSGDFSAEYFDDSYPVYRFLAEGSAVEGPSRTLAFRRVMEKARGTEYHDRWIDLLKRGEIPMEPAERDSMIEKLEIDLASRSPGALAVLSLSLLGAFAFAIFLVGFISRRLMFLS